VRNVIQLLQMTWQIALRRSIAFGALVLCDYHGGREGDQPRFGNGFMALLRVQAHGACRWTGHRSAASVLRIATHEERAERHRVYRLGFGQLQALCFEAELVLGERKGNTLERK
jgi:hypothetical protein